MPTWKHIDSGPNTGARNMAFDEELLARAQAGESVPVLRFYAWSPPAVSLGKFQDQKTTVNADACRKHGFDIVRRITGGRAVLHRRELTYSLIARTDNPLFPSTVLGAYKVISAGLLAGMRALGLPAEIVARENRHAPLVRKRAKDSACFSSPSWYEILVNNRKIVGSAQHRVRGAFLQHGSILIDHDPFLEAEVIPGAGRGDVVTSLRRELGREVSCAEIRQAVLKGFAGALNVRFEAWSP